MAFNTYEISVQDSSPIELYTFARGGLSWRFTSSDTSQTINGYIYEAIPIKRSSLSASQSLQKISLTITMPQNTNFARQFLQTPPSDIMSIEIQRFHITDGEEERIILWTGNIANLKFEELSVEIYCEPISTSFKRPMLRRFYQISCPHVLYGEKCTIDLDTWRVTASVDSFTSLTITSTTFGAYDDGYFSGGVLFFEIYSGAAVEKRFITEHVGDIITINIQIPELVGSDLIECVPGCDHTLTTCNTKFSNRLNFGGCPYIPEKNPMDGTPIF